MDKKPLIGVSICAIILLVLASLSNVAGYQTVQSSNQKTIHDVVDQKELVFQTIVDIANNKEIQGIILKYQIAQGVMPESTIPVVTMKQLKQMYVVGVSPLKTIGKARMHSIVEQYQVNNQVLLNEINTVIEKDTKLNTELTQLSHSECGCKDTNAMPWTFPVLCTLLFPLFIFSVIIFVVSGMQNFILLQIIGTIGTLLNCWWM